MWNLIPWKKNGGDGGALAAEPFEREFSRIRNDFDSLMQRMWSGFPGFGDDFFESRFGLDVDETDTHYVASMPAPGFELSDFDVPGSPRSRVICAICGEGVNDGREVIGADGDPLCRGCERGNYYSKVDNPTA